MCLRELSGSKFHSVTSSNEILLRNKFSSKVDLSGFGTELFNCTGLRAEPGVLTEDIDVANAFN